MTNNNNREKFAQAAQKELEPNIYKHSLALEACLEGLYDYLQTQAKTNLGDKNDWLLAGLVHDIDYSPRFKDQHPNKTREVLAQHGLEISDFVHQVIKDHDGRSGTPPHSLAGWAIRSADSLTGLIVAVALVYPTKTLAEVKLSSVMKRFLKEPKFAAGTRREEVQKCEDPQGLAIPLEKFVEICLNSMKAIAPTLGL